MPIKKHSVGSEPDTTPPFAMTRPRVDSRNCRETGWRWEATAGLKYEENAISGLSEGQILMPGTDGVWEVQNEKGEMFGKERLKDLVRQHAHTPAEEILTCIFESVKDFQQSEKPEDDITLVIVKIED